MLGPLNLEVTSYENANEWAWGLFDASQTRLAGHNVRIDPHDPQGSTFLGTAAYSLDYRSALTSEELDELGEWICERLFGPLADALFSYADTGGGPVYVSAPPSGAAAGLPAF